MRIVSIIVLTLVTVLFVLAGCADLGGAIAQASAWREKALLAQDSLDEQIVELQAQHAGLDPSSPQSQQIAGDIQLAQAQRAALETAIAQANRVLYEAQNPSDSLTHIAHSVSSWVPAPAQGPIVLGAALIATLARSRQLKQSTMSIVQSIAHVIERDEQFRALFESHADTIRTIQTPGARQLVDKAQRLRAPS